MDRTHMVKWFRAFHLQPESVCGAGGGASISWLSHTKDFENGTYCHYAWYLLLSMSNGVGKAS